jgi:lysophospholipase L1-like esterase
MALPPDSPKPEGQRRVYLQADGIHLEPAGHTMMARLVFDSLIP